MCFVAARGLIRANLVGEAGIMSVKYRLQNKNNQLLTPGTPG